MEVINELNINIEALVAFKIGKQWEKFRPIDNPRGNGLPGTVVNRRQNSKPGKVKIELKADDLKATEFSVHLYCKKIPKKSGAEGVKVHLGMYRKVHELGNKCREVHHVEVKRLSENRVDDYKYCIEIHYNLHDNRPKCPDINELHKDPTVIHPDEPGGSEEN
jgi:hypothetical protein